MMESVAQEINYLSALSGVRCSDWRHIIIARAQSFRSGGSAPIVDLVQYTTPAGSGLLITRIYLRSSEQVIGGGLTTTDFRSDDIDQDYKTQAWLEINNRPITSVDGTFFALFNKPVLIGVNAGQRLAVRAQGLGDFQQMRVATALHGYLVPLVALDRLASNTSLFISEVDFT